MTARPMGMNWVWQPCQIQGAGIMQLYQIQAPWIKQELSLAIMLLDLG
jgi:hypothetical protein